MFQIDEIVMVKRTSGEWQEATVKGINDYFVVVEFDIGDTYRGQKWDGDKTLRAIKKIPLDEVDKFVIKMKTYKENN